MIEDEHREICEADKATKQSASLHYEINIPDGEMEFLRKARKLLEEEFPEHIHPLNKDPLPRSQPCHGFMATHKLEFDPRTKTYNPVPKVPEHERGD